MTAKPQLMLSRKWNQASKPEMELHMENIMYTALLTHAQTEKTTFSCKDDCTLTKHTWRCTYYSRDFAIPLCHIPPFRSFLCQTQLSLCYVEFWLREFFQLIFYFLWLKSPVLNMWLNSSHFLQHESRVVHNCLGLRPDLYFQWWNRNHGQGHLWVKLSQIWFFIDWVQSRESQKHCQGGTFPGNLGTRFPRNV